MKRTQVFVVALFGAVIGCAATQAVQVHYADAQYEPGQMRECSWIGIGRNHRHPASVQVPPGWTAVSGLSDRAILICR